LNGSSEPLRILQLADRFSAGGVPRIMELVAGTGKSRGWDVKTAFWFGDAPAGWNASEVGHKTGLPAKVAALNRLISGFRPHIIHDHYGGLPAAAFVFRSRGAKTVFHLHNELVVHPESPDKTRPVKTTLFRKAVLPFYDAWIAVSKHSAAQLAQVCEASKGKTSVLPNAIAAVPGQELSKQEARQRLGLDENRFVILGLGRLVFEKGFRLHIQALAELRKQIPDALLVLAGDGDDRYIRALHAEAQALGVSEAVHFTGRMNEVGVCYRAADVFLFASHQEPFGLTLLESMVCECPVIAVLPDFGGGPQEFLVQGKNVLIAERDAKAVSTALLSLHHAPATAKMLVNGALSTIDVFSAQAYNERLTGFYRTLGFRA
jgi:glycosyltransferase involved in cell wall biosynthesis